MRIITAERLGVIAGIGFGTLLLYGLFRFALIFTPLSPLGGLTEHFDDMEQKMAQITLPFSHKLINERQSGGKPPFFGAFPIVERIYVTDNALDDVCHELGAAISQWGEVIEPSSSDSGQQDGRCVYSIYVDANVTAKVLGTSRYVLHVTATNIEEREGRRISGQSQPASPLLTAEADNVSETPEQPRVRVQLTLMDTS